MKSQKMAQFHDVINPPWLMHNHPSGDPTPSRNDVELTKEIVAAAKTLGIAVHDHLIVAKQYHASLKGMGMM